VPAVAEHAAPNLRTSVTTQPRRSRPHPAQDRSKCSGSLPTFLVAIGGPSNPGNFQITVANETARNSVWNLRVDRSSPNRGRPPSLLFVPISMDFIQPLLRRRRLRSQACVLGRVRSSRSPRSSIADFLRPGVVRWSGGFRDPPHESDDKKQGGHPYSARSCVIRSQLELCVSLAISAGRFLCSLPSGPPQLLKQAESQRSG